MEDYIGIVKLFAGNFAPVGWYLCNGQLLQINQNQALFAIIGTTYGGNGTTTFALPDLRGRAAISQGQGAGLQNYALGQTGGVENVTLLSTQMPLHTHTMSASTTAGTADTPAGNVLAVANGVTSVGGESVVVNGYISGPINAQMNPQAIGAAGGNQAHENRPPFLALNYIICAEGIFPSRS